MLLEHLVSPFIRTFVEVKRESLGYVSHPSSLDLVLIEEECVLCVLEVLIYRLLGLIERVRVGLSVGEELLEHEEELVPVKLLLYIISLTLSRLLIYLLLFSL